MLFVIAFKKLDVRRYRVMNPAVAAYRELSAVERANTVRKAKWMLVLEANDLFRDGIHSSLGHFAERNGSTAELGRMELDLGYAMRHFPELEDLVLEGEIPPAAAAVLGRVVRQGLLRPDDDWIEWARVRSARQLYRLYVMRRDEQLAGDAVRVVTTHLTAEAVADLARCRVLVSRTLKKPTTTGMTIAVLAKDYRRRHDPLWRKPGTRRVPDTHGVRGRYVPAEVDREVRGRTGDGCRFPACDNEIWLDRAHHIPHRELGCREGSNLHLLCGQHHRLFDNGRFLIRGTPKNPQFFRPDGRRITVRDPVLRPDPSPVFDKPPPAPGAEGGPPPRCDGPPGRAA
jgi:hypothetical protein